MKSADAIVFALFLICGCGIGAAYVGSARHSRTLPQEPGFNQRIFGAALMSVCGRGLVTPDVPMTAGADTAPGRRPLIDFLAQRRETIPCGEIPGDVPVGGLDGMQRASRYLLVLVSSTWDITGPAWSGIDRLLGLMFGVSIGLAYLVSRLAMGRVAAAGIAALLMLSPIHLVNLPDLRDYSKTPFFLATLLIVGLLATRRLRSATVVGLSAAAGAVLGFGFGVRTDVVVNLVLVLLVIAGFLPERLAESWKVRLVATAVCLAGFAAVASPIVGSGASGSNVWHWALLGYAHEWDQALEIAPAPYESGYFYDDSYVATLVDAYRGRVTREPDRMSVGVPKYAEASRAYYALLLGTFPADALLRGWSSVLHVLDLPYSGVHAIPGGLLPSGLTRLIALLGRVRILFAGMGVAFFGITVLAVSVRSVRLAVLMFGLVALLGAYPAVQFQLRHAFHLEFLSLWILGFSASSLYAMVFQKPRSAAAPPTDGPGRRLVLQPVAFALCVAGLVFVPLTTLRAYQQRTVTALLASYEAARVVPVGDISAAAGSESVRVMAGPGMMLHQGEARSMNSDMLVAELSSSGCPVDRVALTFSDKTNDSSLDFGRTVDVEIPPAGEPVRIFFPIFETGTTNLDPEPIRFGGLNVVASERPCVKNVSRFAQPDNFPLLLNAVLAPGWRGMPLHQTLRRAASSWENHQPTAYWAPFGLRNQRPTLFARLAAARPGIDAAVDYSARIAIVGPGASVTVSGVAEAPDSYLVAWKALPLVPTNVVVADGRLERGGLTIGLTDSSGWAARVEIDTPGTFRALVQPTRPGHYQLVVANHLSNTTLSNRFTVSRIVVLDGEHD